MDEIIELDLNKPWPDQYSSMEQEKSAKKPREFIRVVGQSYFFLLCQRKEIEEDNRQDIISPIMKVNIAYF